MTRNFDQLAKTYKQAYESYIERSYDSELKSHHNGKLQGIKLCAYDLLSGTEYCEFMKFVGSLEAK